MRPTSATVFARPEVHREHAPYPRVRPGIHGARSWASRAYLLVKVFAGHAGWRFSLSFIDTSGEPVTDGLEIRQVPDGVSCVEPPLTVTRRIDSATTTRIEHEEQPSWEADTSYPVRLELAALRDTSADCGTPAEIIVRETVPRGWTPVSASHDGVIDGEQISWTISPGDGIPAALECEVRSGETPGDARFMGRVRSSGDGVSFAIGGDRRLAQPSSLTEDGFLASWLLLGPYETCVEGGFVNPGCPGIAELSGEYLTDGDGLTEATVAPHDGDEAATDFSVAASCSLVSPDPFLPIDPAGVPTWSAWHDSDETIDFCSYYGGDAAGTTVYAFAYLEVESAIEVDLALASGDAVQVFLDGEAVWSSNICRAVGEPGTVDDRVRLQLSEGVHGLLVTVLNGTGGHALRPALRRPGHRGARHRRDRCPLDARGRTARAALRAQRNERRRRDGPH